MHADSVCRSAFWRSPRTLSSIQRRTDSNKPIASLKKFADELGAPVKFVLTPGSGHHLSLELYAAAFPDAEAIVIVAVKAKLGLETRHVLEVDERYVITSGRGRVEVEGLYFDDINCLVETGRRVDTID